MKQICVCLMMAVSLAIPSGGALAAQPFYFYKANVDRETFVSDFFECNELASGIRTPSYNVYSPNIYAMAAASFFAGFLGSVEKRGMIENVLRTCMADKGYRRVSVPRRRGQIG